MLGTFQAKSIHPSRAPQEPHKVRGMGMQPYSLIHVQVSAHVTLSSLWVIFHHSSCPLVTQPMGYWTSKPRASQS